MLISHEVPIKVLGKSRHFNDYDYCLLHLTYENPEYRHFYVDSIKKGRKVLLDNSLFELGDALTNDQLAQGVLDIRPTWYVVPDCLNDKSLTIERFENFKKHHSDLPGKAIGVTQGSTLSDLVDCYEYMSAHADKIAIPFDSAAFDDLSSIDSTLERWCMGRQLFIQHLVDIGKWNSEKPHHLLGCSLAKEFANKLYKQISIESCDTSNPIVAGMYGFKYGRDGLNKKPSTKLCDLINTEVSDDQIACMQHNIEMFRRICNG